MQKNETNVCFPEELNILLTCGGLRRSWCPIKKN